MTYHQKTTKKLRKFPAPHTHYGLQNKAREGTFSRVRGKFWVPFHAFQDIVFEIFLLSFLCVYCHCNWWQYAHSPLRRRRKKKQVDVTSWSLW